MHGYDSKTWIGMFDVPPFNDDFGVFLACY